MGSKKENASADLTFSLKGFVLRYCLHMQLFMREARDGVNVIKFTA